ncbi:ABC transporter substrate-binding protein [Rugosimonospora africana]|uniref:ABC transporter substrate-binding protein n=1 Tax=Rugosimonospora africana TaxID=556532 RepID=A0A8J3QYQ1_9ACTN|nr:ABC transporter substrate-binding protein [Rugosimonospora africana]GIH19845.1 ABC transporter substrate-binding protein [Rugosimonospora africana]
MTARLRGRLRAATPAVLATLVLLSTACTSPSHHGDQPPPHAGGTLLYLRSGAGFVHLDPQRDFLAQDQAFAGGYLQRTLTTYTFSDRARAATLVPDLATDTGRPSRDARTWAFTLRKGVSFQNGQPIRCQDIRYGLARAFAGSALTGVSPPAVAMLDIPRDAHGEPTYQGPYPAPGNNTGALDRAVACSPDGRTITFHLNRPAADFNDTVALLTYSPVPQSLDTGTQYDQRPVSSGPYEIAQNAPGSRLVLVRNPHWNRASDPVRPAYPDRVVTEIGVPDTQIQQRLIADADADQAAVANLSAPSAQAVFADPKLAGRRYDGTNGNVDYLAINTTRVADLQQRRAIVAALDVGALNAAAGGDLDGTRADGLVSPALGIDYQPTGLWDGLLGKDIPTGGDPSYARQLIAESGRPMPVLTYDYIESAGADRAATIVVSSLARAGITVRAHALSPQVYYPTVRDPRTASDLVFGSAAPNWHNASALLADLLTPSGSLNLSQYDDATVTRDVHDGQTQLDRDAQARQWSRLDRSAMLQAVAVPLRFEHAQALVGSRVGGAYIWAPYGSLPFGALWVRP